MKDLHVKEGHSVGAAIEQIASGLAGRIGFAAQEIGGDEVIAFNGDETFAMASTYKVAIATNVLDRVDKGELRLDQLVDVPHDMYVAGEIAIAETFPYPGVQLSVANLIDVMITESDNTATDVCMGLAGGPAAVTENLRRLGITDFRVDRLTREILRISTACRRGHARSLSLRPSKTTRHWRRRRLIPIRTSRRIPATTQRPLRC